MAKHVSPDDDGQHVIEVSLSDEDAIDDEIHVAPSTEALALDWAKAIQQDPSLKSGDRLEQAAQYRRWASDRGVVDPPSFADIRFSLGYSKAGFAGSSTHLPQLDGHDPVKNLPDPSPVTTLGVLPDAGLTRSGGSGGIGRWRRKDAANHTLRLGENQHWKNDRKKKQDAEEQVKAKWREVQDHHKQEEERRRKEVIQRMQENVQRSREEEQSQKHKRDGVSLIRKQHDLEEERKRRKKEDDDRRRWIEVEDCRKRRESDFRRWKHEDLRLRREQEDRLTEIISPKHHDVDWVNQQSVPLKNGEKLNSWCLSDRFHEDHNPVKLTDVDEFLLKDAGQDADMNAHICEKYGAPSVARKKVSDVATVVPSSSRVYRGATKRDLDHSLFAEEVDKDLWHRFELLQKLSRYGHSSCNGATTVKGVATAEFASVSTADSHGLPSPENELWDRFQNLLKC